MKKNQLLFLLSLLAGACSSNNTTPVNDQLATPVGVEEAIATSNRMYWQAFTTGDSTLFTERYAADACIMPADASALCGPNAAPAFFRVAYRQMGIRGGHFTTQGVWGSGDYATEQGLFELRNAHQTVLGRGKYLVLWKKTAAGWKMFRDSFSPDHPTPPATEPAR